MNFSKNVHFNLVHFSKLLKRVNKHINIDMKNLTNRLIANKISLNVNKMN